jgi:hypothetical protein
MTEIAKAAQAMDRMPIIDREQVHHNSPEGTALAWTLNTEGPGAHKYGDGGSLFILSPVDAHGHVNQVVELEDYERALHELHEAREAATLYKLAGDGAERAQALAQLLNVLGLA